MFGRLKEPDRSQNERYMIRDRRRNLFMAVGLRTKLWGMGALLDQGDTGTCVGHGHKAGLMASPVRGPGPLMSPTAFDIYRGACHLDPWPDNDNEDLNIGTSVRAGADFLKKQGLIREYNWAYTADDAIQALMLGPVVIGVDWYSGMMQVDAEGVIRANGDIYGGHCVCLLGWDNARGMVIGINSWGRDFGRILRSGLRNGRFYLPAEDFRRLMANQGEAVQLVEHIV
jgi:hypothetical protein